MDSFFVERFMERGFSRIWRIFADFFGRYIIYGFGGFFRIRSRFCCASFPLCLCVKKSFN
ncbi:MAG: hypothetical protein FWG87_06565 [Defluviitaleaceae bacterium]|nr:hypothetical protein [Defluviitaleaceae bacterium]